MYFFSTFFFISFKYHNRSSSVIFSTLSLFSLPLYFSHFPMNLPLFSCPYLFFWLLSFLGYSASLLLSSSSFYSSIFLSFPTLPSPSISPSLIYTDILASPSPSFSPCLSPSFPPASSASTSLHLGGKEEGTREERGGEGKMGGRRNVV